MPLIPTQTLVRSFRLDPVIEKTIPPNVFLSLPVPLLIRNVPCLGFFCYPATGKAGEPKQIFPPAFRVVRSLLDGRVLSLDYAAFFLPQKVDFKQPVGTYPPASLRGKTVEQADALYEQYYAVCDTILKQMGTQSMQNCPAWTDWKTLFVQLAEEGYAPYFLDLLERNDKQNETGTPQERKNVVVQKPEETLPAQTHAPAVNNPKPEPAVKQVHLSRFLHTAHELAQKSDAETIQNALTALGKEQAKAIFKVAVIGEFSRGKTHFLNRLLEIDVLPEGNLPTTAVVTKISHDENACVICRQLKTGEAIREPLTERAFEKFSIQSDGTVPTGVLDVRMPIPWLKGHKIALFDTPGAGDVLDHRFQTTTHLIHNCDAAIMVISANMACSMTELEFLRENVLLKGLPNLAVVISRLDQIAPAQQTATIEYIEQRIHAEAPMAQLWSLLNKSDLPDACGGLFNALGAAAIRERIIQWSQSSNLAKLRQRRTAFKVLEQVNRLTGFLDSRIEATNRTVEQNQEKAAQMRSAIQSQTLGWEKLVNATGAYRLQTLEWSQTELAQMRERFKEDLALSVKRSPNLPKWQEEEFPYMLHRFIDGLSVKIETGAVSRLEAFRTKLEQEVNKTYSGTLGRIAFEKKMSDLPEYESSMELENVERYKTIQRLGSMAILPAALFLVAPPFGMIVGGIGAGISALVTEMKMRDALEQQRQNVIDHLLPQIDLLFSNWESNIESFINAGFEAVVQEVKTQSRNWFDTQNESVQKALEEGNQDSARKRLEAIKSAAAVLTSEIQREIQ